MGGQSHYFSGYNMIIMYNYIKKSGITHPHKSLFKSHFPILDIFKNVHFLKFFPNFFWAIFRKVDLEHNALILDFGNFICDDKIFSEKDLGIFFVRIYIYEFLTKKMQKNAIKFYM